MFLMWNRIAWRWIFLMCPQVAAYLAKYSAAVPWYHTKYWNDSNTKVFPSRLSDTVGTGKRAIFTVPSVPSCFSETHLLELVVDGSERLAAVMLKHYQIPKTKFKESTSAAASLYSLYIISINWRHICLIDLVSATGKTNVSWLISFHSLIRQCLNILILGHRSYARISYNSREISMGLFS